EARRAVPCTAFAVSTNGAPPTSVASPPSNAPSRIFSPCKSCNIVMGRPQSASPSRISRMTSPCSAWVPWEKFRRATSMPAATSRSSMARSRVAGPMVQTILARLTARPSARQRPGEVLAGIRQVGVTGELFGRAGRDDAAALVAALGPEVHDEVRGLDDVQVVLDDHDRIALVDELVQHLEQAPDVGEVQSGGRLVQDVEGPPRRPPAELGG